METYLRKEARRHGSSLQVNIRMKAKALKTCEVFVKGIPKYNPKDKTLIGFLKSL